MIFVLSKFYFIYSIYCHYIRRISYSYDVFIKKKIITVRDFITFMILFSEIFVEFIFYNANLFNFLKIMNHCTCFDEI